MTQQSSKLLRAFHENGDPASLIADMVENSRTDEEIHSAIGAFVSEEFDLDPAIQGVRNKLKANGSNDEASILERPRLQPILLSDLGRLPKREPLIEGVYDRHAFSLMFGVSNIGKSLIAIHKAAHIVLGRDWCGRKVRQGPVVYLACEGGLGIAERFVAFFQYHQLPTRGAPLYVIPDPIDLCKSEADFKLLVTNINEAVEQPPELIVIDTLSQAMAGGNENAPDDMGRFVRNCNRLRKATGAHVECLHHPGKDESKGARGHSSLRAAVDTEIEITRNEISGVISATVAKQRDHATGATFHFRIAEVVIDQCEDGSHVTAPVLDIETEVPVQAETKPMHKIPRTAKIAEKSLYEALQKHGQRAPPSDDIPATARVVELNLWRKLAYLNGISLGEDRAKQIAFKKGVQYLVDHGKVRVVDDFAWIPE